MLKDSTPPARCRRELFEYVCCVNARAAVLICHPAVAEDGAQIMTPAVKPKGGIGGAPEILIDPASAILAVDGAVSGLVRFLHTTDGNSPRWDCEPSRQVCPFTCQCLLASLGSCANLLPKPPPPALLRDQTAHTIACCVRW